MKIKTKTQRLIDAIRQAESIRSPELSRVTRIDRSSISALLRTAIDAGEVVSCKVRIPGAPEMNEYRIGSGVAPPAIPAPLKVGRRVEFARSTPGRGAPPPEAVAEASLINPFAGDELAPTRGLHHCVSSTQREVVDNTRSDRSVSSQGTTSAEAIAVERPTPPRAAWGDDTGMLDKIPTMTPDEFGAYVAFLSRLWSWGNVANGNTLITTRGSARVITHSAGA